MSDLEGGTNEFFPPSSLNGSPSLRGRNPQAAQSLRQIPISPPPVREIRKTHSAPLRPLQDPSYLANPSYPSPRTPMQYPMSPPVLYPQYASPIAAQNMYYSAPQQPAVIIRQNQPPLPYGNFDPNFEAYFGPDVRTTQQSSLAMQRDQFQSFEQSRPRQFQSARPVKLAGAC
jgi:hypothetical protein